MSLVKGFRDILTPVNQAFNGAFMINQRNLFGSLTAPIVGDWVCDCWKVTTQTMSSCQIQNSVSGWIRVQANARKGQILKFENFGVSSLAAHTTSAHKALVTAELTVSRGDPTAPFEVIVSPPYASGVTVKYADPSVFTAPSTGNYMSRILTRVFETNPNFGTRASIEIKALADGFIDMYLYNFKWVVGGFSKLPLWLGNDVYPNSVLAQNWYQSGLTIPLDEMIPVKDSGTATFGCKYIRFPVTMASTPTIITSYAGSGGNLQYRLASGAAVTSETNTNWSVSVSDVSNKGFKVKFERTTYLANIMAVGPADTNGVLYWTATVG